MKLWRALWAGLALAGLLVTPCWGLEAPEVVADELRAMMGSRDVLLVYPLSDIEFNNLHIPGSVNLPIETLAQTLPADRDRPIVFYCLGRN